MSDRYAALCICLAILAGAAVMISDNLRSRSPEEIRVDAFKQCMRGTGTTEVVCKEVISETKSNSR